MPIIQKHLDYSPLDTVTTVRTKPIGSGHMAQDGYKPVVCWSSLPQPVLQLSNAFCTGVALCSKLLGADPCGCFLTCAPFPPGALLSSTSKFRERVCCQAALPPITLECMQGCGCTGMPGREAMDMRSRSSCSADAQTETFPPFWESGRMERRRLGLAQTFCLRNFPTETKRVKTRRAEV